MVVLSRRGPWTAGLLFFLLPSSLFAFDEVIDSPMYRSPELPTPRVVMVFPEEAIGLWLKALERPEADMRCKAADAIGLAQRRGMKGLATTIAPLLVALDRPDQHPTVRLPVAQALIALEAREAAPSLFRHAQSGSNDLRDIVEPALARWDHRPARAVWLARLSAPEVSPRSLILAIHGLAVVREMRAADRLREMVLSAHVTGPVRLEAARALAVLRTTGLETDAERLAADGSPRGMAARLAAASLLLQHTSAQAIALLERLGRDPEPAVAAVAVARLLEVDPKLVVPAVEQLLGKPDARLRSLAIEVLFRQPTEQHIRLLGEQLHDPHPELRIKARRSLHQLAAAKDFHDAVIEQGTRILATREWRGLEQAAILLAQLEHKAASKRLLELLAFDRPEVYVTAAWALRRLAVPETLPEVVRFVEAQERRLRAAAARPDAAAILIDHQLAQLNQLLGQQRHAPAMAVLRQFIPRMERPMSQPVGMECRAAAVWALGVIHEGKTDPALAAILEKRLNDTQSMPPEDPRIRWMCALTLGRLRAKEALPSLRTFCPMQEATFAPINNACGWAIEQLTGEVMPAPKTVEKVQRDWFLTPYR